MPLFYYVVYMTDLSKQLIHASCVQFLSKGLLIVGPSASGKSDLSLRLMDEGAKLVSDDQVLVTVEQSEHHSKLRAEAPEKIKGLIELRGYGIIPVPHDLFTYLDLVIELKPFKELERLSYLHSHWILGCSLPKMMVDAAWPSSVSRIKVVLSMLSEIGQPHPVHQKI